MKHFSLASSNCGTRKSFRRRVTSDEWGERTKQNACHELEAQNEDL